MTTPGYPDWTSPVAAIDRAVSLTNGIAFLNPGGQLGPYDVSQVQAVSFELVTPTGVPGDRYLLNIEWTEANSSVGDDTLSIHSNSSYGNVTSGVEWTMPVRGSLMTPKLQGAGAGTWQLRGTGYTRALLQSFVRQATTAWGREIASFNPGNIAAGGSSAVFYLPPVAKTLRIVTSYNNALVQLELKGVYWDGAAMNTQRIAELTCQTTNFSHFDIDVPFIATELTVFNRDAAAHTGNVQVWDVS